MSPKGIVQALDTFDASYLLSRRYARDTKNLEMELKSMSRSKCPKWYTSLRHPKRNPHTNFGIPTSNDIGYMLQKPFF